MSIQNLWYFDEIFLFVISKKALNLGVWLAQALLFAQSKGPKIEQYLKFLPSFFSELRAFSGSLLCAILDTITCLFKKYFQIL